MTQQSIDNWYRLDIIDADDALEEMSAEALLEVLNNADSYVELLSRAYQIYWYRYISSVDKLNDDDVLKMLRYRNIFPLEAQGLLVHACGVSKFPTESVAKTIKLMKDGRFPAPEACPYPQILTAYEMCVNTAVAPMDRLNFIVSQLSSTDGWLEPYARWVVTELRQSDYAWGVRQVVDSGMAPEYIRSFLHKLQKWAKSVGVEIELPAAIPSVPISELDATLYAVRSMSLTELRQILLDGDAPDAVRRKAFVWYWKDYYASMDDPPNPCTFGELEQILARRNDWPEETDKLIDTLCYWQLLDVRLVTWLLESLPDESRSKKRVYLYYLQNYSDADLTSRVGSAFAFSAENENAVQKTVIELVEEADLSELGRIEGFARAADLSEMTAFCIDVAIRRRRRVFRYADVE